MCVRGWHGRRRKNILHEKAKKIAKKQKKTQSAGIILLRTMGLPSPEEIRCD